MTCYNYRDFYSNEEPKLLKSALWIPHESIERLVKANSFKLYALKINNRLNSQALGALEGFLGALMHCT